MAGNFHRLSTPGYFVTSGSFPTEAGVTYDYINNAGSGTPASADNAKIGGVNAGTYFVAFSEDATSNNTNRGFKALAQNCDHIDDILHKSLALPVRTNTATAPGGGTTSVVVPAGTYLGPTGTTNNAAGLAPIFEILDENDEEFLNAGVTVKVNTITLSGGDTIGGNNFSTNTVTLNISPAIPAGQQYRIHYATRTNLATIPTDAFSFINIRGAQEVDGTVKQLFEDLHGNGGSWNGAWESTIYDLTYDTLDRAYRNAQERSTLSSYGGDYFGVDYIGSLGSWIWRDATALTIYGQQEGVGQDPINANIAVKHQMPTLWNTGGQTGVVVYGSRRLMKNPSNTVPAAMTDETLNPEYATFLSLTTHSQWASSLMTHYTRIPVGTACTLSNTSTDADVGNAELEITDTVNAWFRDASNNTAVIPGYTMLEIQYTVSSIVNRQVFVVTAHGSQADTTSRYKVRLRRQNGRVPNFTGATSATIRTWHSVNFAIGDGAASFHKARYGSGSLLDSMVFFAPTKISAASGTEDIDTGGAKFYANTQDALARALSWGGVAPVNGVLSTPGGLCGDGSVLAPYTQFEVSEGNRFQPANALASTLTGPTVAPTLFLATRDTWVYTLKNTGGDEDEPVTITSITFNTAPSFAYQTIKVGAKYTLVFKCDATQTGGVVADGSIFPSNIRGEADTDENFFLGPGDYIVFEFMCVDAGALDFVLTNVTYADT